MQHVLIMAGGQSSRMRNTTHVDTHKALVTVFDIPLIELNLLYAYIFGCRTCWIAVSAKEASLIAYIDQLQRRYEAQLGIEIKTIIEQTPLGTIGAAQYADTGDEDLLVLNVDNLLNLDLTAFMDAHTRSKAVMTIASHEESFQVPFGELMVEGDIVTDYLEKPRKKILVSSGTYVLSAKAKTILRERYPDKQIDIPAFSKGLMENNHTVHSFFHASIWNDINDKDTLSRTRSMEQWPLIDEISKLRQKHVAVQ